MNAPEKMKQYDRTTQDVGNIVHLEHFNCVIDDQRLAVLFYVVGMGGTRDPYIFTGFENIWLRPEHRRRSFTSRIAATNAISDIYAMGGRPIMALAIVGMPLEKLPVSAIRGILAGGESVCASVEIPIAGGHSIDTLEPIYGLVALGLVHPSKVKKNSTARAGDALILGKPLGIGILSAALKKGKLSAAGYAEMLKWTTQLNTAGQALADMPAVHALTDVTGFGLAGHLLEMCRGATLGAEVSFEALPVIAEALDWVKQGVATGASERNWKGYGLEVDLPAGFPEWKRKLIADPQTSGGLLVACAPEAVSQVLKAFNGDARTIGRFVAGAPRLRII